MIRGTLWYVVSKLELVVENIRQLMQNGDQLLVVQNFPPLESNFIGKDLMPDHHSLIVHFSSSFKLERHLWYMDSSKTKNDNWFIDLFRLKD